jgi:hypothetical protein
MNNLKHQAEKNEQETIWNKISGSWTKPRIPIVAG